MSHGTGKRRFHFKSVRLHDLAIQRFGEWSVANRGFYESFRQWLKDGNYSDSALSIYGAAVRTAIGYLRKEYWQIDPDVDIACVIAHLEQRPLSPNTRADYQKGLKKFTEYLRLRFGRPQKAKELHWDYHIGSLPAELQQDIRDFIHFCQHSWKVERQFERSADTLFTLSRPLRWMNEHFRVKDVSNLTPQLWYAWLDKRLSDGIGASTLNGELSALKHFVYFLRDLGRPVSERFILVDRLVENKTLPKDVPIEQLRLLQKAIQKQIHTGNAGQRRLGRMDLAWFLLMLHSGLRTGEIRCLKLSDIEWEAKRVHIEQSKGLKDRLVPLSKATIQALKSYLEVRGPSEALPEYVFIFRHTQLTRSYCSERLKTYCAGCGFRTQPHRLRHSCATLLLNAGAPVLSVQTILGHKQIDTTLGYARLYDGTVAADYYSAMDRVERQLALPDDFVKPVPSIGELIALTDALHRVTLSPTQTEIVRALRSGLVALAGQVAKVEELTIV